MNQSVILIQGTNDFSTVSKYSMVQNGYFKDEYISHFVQQHNRRAPLINLGYFVRARVVDFTLQTFLQMSLGGSAQVISCGAGFDSNFFRLTSCGILPRGITYYEVDFIEVVKRKAKCILKSEPLMDAVGKISDHPPVILMSTSYRLVAADLRNLPALESALEDAGMNFSLPTLFLSECSITYMDEESSSRLIEWASSKFENASFVTYEQICPNDGFGLIMLNHFESLGSPLLSVRKYGDFNAQRNRYLSKGWTSCSALSAFDIFMQITDIDEQQRVLSLEPFDEFEEWHLKCCHYTLIIASNNDFGLWPKSLTISPSNTSFHLQAGFQWTLMNIEGFMRFGHKSVQINEDVILVVGGFGSTASDKSHRRLNEVALVSHRSAACSNVKVKGDCIHPTSLICLHHSLTLLGDNTCAALLYGGRTSPRKPVNVEPLLVTVKNGDVNVAMFPTNGSKQKKPVPRWRHSAVLMDPERVVIFGGRNPELEVLGDLWYFVLATDFSSISYEQITVADAIQPCPRFSHSASMVASESSVMVITGGIRGHDFLPLSDIWLFYGANRKWLEIVTEGPAMLPRYGHTSAVFQEKLILLGGVNTLSGQQPGVCVINMKIWSCMEYYLPDQDIKNPILLHNHSSEHMKNGSEVVVIGGGGNCFSFGTALNKCLVTIDLLQFM